MEQVTQVSADVVIQQNNDLTRVTQESGDVILQPTGNERLSQISAEAILTPNPNARLTQAFLEVAFQLTSSGQYGVWLDSSTASTVTTLRLRIIHAVLLASSVLIATLSTLYGLGHSVALAVSSLINRVFTALLINSPYVIAVLNDQPTLYYRLDDTGPIAKDSSINQQDFTWVGTPTFQVPGATLDGDTAITTAGAPYGQLPHDPLYTPGGSFTVEAWVKTTAPTTENTILCKFQAGGSYPGFLFSVNAVTPAGHVNLYLGNTWYNSSTAVNDNLWHHVVAVYDSIAATLSFYRDGSPDGVISNPLVNLTNSQVLQIAGRYDVSTFFNGSLDEVALYMYPLTATQIQSHYQVGRTAHLILQVASGVRSWWHVVKGTVVTYLFDLMVQSPVGVIASRLLIYKNVVLSDDPTAYYRLDEANGPAAVDSSGNGNNGTYSGTGIGFHATGAIAGGDLAVSMPGSGDATVAVPFMNSNMPGGFSVEGWFNPAHVPGSTIDVRLWMWWVEGSDDYIWCANNRTGQLSFYIYQGGSSQSISTVSTTILPITQYSHVVCTWVNGTGTIYVNGTSIISGAMWAPNNVARQGGIADSNDLSAGEQFEGLVDEFAVYDHALTAAQVLTHYNASTNLIYGGAVFLHSVAATVSNSVSVVATNIYRRYQQALAALSSVTATVETFRSGASSHVLTVSSAVGTTLATALQRLYSQLLQAAAISLSNFQQRRVVGLLLSVVSFSSSALLAVEKFLYFQAVVALTSSAPVIGLQRFFHFLLSATPGAVATIGDTIYRQTRQTVLALAGSALGIGFQYHWTKAMLAVNTTLVTSTTIYFHQFLQAMTAVATMLGALTTNHTLQRVIAAVGSSNAGIAMVHFYRRLQNLMAQAGQNTQLLTGYGYQLLLLAVSHSTGAIRTSMTRAQALLAQGVSRLVIMTNHSVLVTHAMAAVTAVAGAIIRTRALELLAQSPAVVTLYRLLSLSLTLVAVSVTQAFRFIQKLTQQTYPWSDLPPLIGIGSPGPYFAIDGDDSFKQPDHFRIIPRPLFGISIRHRPLYSGWPAQEWSWADLSTAEFARLMTFWSAGGPWFTIRWYGADGGLHTARAHMHEPAVGNRVNLRLLSVTVTFTEVQPATTEVAPAWTALAWHPPQAAVITAKHLIRTLAVQDSGILIYDNQATQPWSWTLHEPTRSGVYQTALDPNDPTKKTMLATRFGPDPSWTRTSGDQRSAGNIWRTTDGGITWFPTATASTPLMAVAPAPFITSGGGYFNPVFVPGTPGRALCLTYYTTNEMAFGVVGLVSYLGIGESTNGGASWTLQTALKDQSIGESNPTSEPVVPHWATSPDGRYFAVATSTGSAHTNICSRDGGNTWANIPLPSSNFGYAYWIVIDQLHSETWYAVARSQITHLMRSLDAGQTWTDYFPASNLPPNDGGNFGVGIASFLVGHDPLGKANDVFYLVTDNAAAPGTPGGYTNLTGDMLTWTHNGWLDRVVADAWIDPQDLRHLVYAEGGFRLSESVNRGSSWNDISIAGVPPLQNSTISSLEVLDP